MEEKMTINRTERIAQILKKYDFTGVRTKLSYINRLFPHLGYNAEVILLCHIPLDISIKDEIHREEQPSALDFTGSPLTHSFGDESFNVTLTVNKRNWLKYEEQHQPIPKQIATTMLNAIHEEIGFDENWTLPLFALCNATNDRAQVVLLGSHYDSSWFITYRVTTPAMKSLISIQNGCKELLIEHLKKSAVSENNIDVTITSTYELCGISNDMIDWREQSKNEFTGYLKVEATWNDLCFAPSPRGISNNVIVQIMSGSRESPLYDLWNQILLLNKYLSILEEYRRKDLSSRYSVMPLQFPKDFLNPYLQDDSIITHKLHRFLSGDDNFDEDDEIDSEIPSRDANICEIKLTDLVKELSIRENADFTDRLWRIIRETENYMQMTDCIHTVFESITENNYKPQLNDMDKTRFAKIVSDLECENRKVSLLAGSLSLELVIDMGIEKIGRDYMYLLSNMNIMEAYDFRKTLPHVATCEFDIEKYRIKLMNLAQIHISLEFLQLIQSQLNCRFDVMHSIFEFTSKKYCGINSPLKYEDLIHNTIYTLNMPAKKEFMTAVDKIAPTSWMCTLSTTESVQKLTTINHYSRMPIFPPNIYESDTAENNHEEDGVYHVVAASIRYLKRN